MYIVLLRSCGLLQRMGKDYDNVKGMLNHSILTIFLLYWLFYSVNNINVIAFAETFDSVVLSWGKFCQSEVSLMIILFIESHNSLDSSSFCRKIVSCYVEDGEKDYMGLVSCSFDCVCVGTSKFESVWIPLLSNIHA